MAIAKTVKKNKGYCHDCNAEIKIENNEIKNGVLLKYNSNNEELKVMKCRACFQENPSLTNFRECEVYSRVVGYLRPVQQWNIGKKGEFQDRKVYGTPDNNH